RVRSARSEGRGPSRPVQQRSTSGGEQGKPTVRKKRCFVPCHIHYPYRSPSIPPLVRCTGRDVRRSFTSLAYLDSTPVNGPNYLGFTASNWISARALASAGRSVLPAGNSLN